jgi:hypothetical protein
VCIENIFFSDVGGANSPLLGTSFLLLSVTGDLPLSRLRILYKRTLLLVEFTENTKDRPFVDDTATLPSSASVTRSFPTGSDVTNARECGGRLS